MIVLRVIFPLKIAPCSLTMQLMVSENQSWTYNVKCHIIWHVSKFGSQIHLNYVLRNQWATSKVLFLCVYLVCTCRLCPAVYLSNELQYLGLGVWRGEDPQALQPAQASLDLPLLLLQGQVAVGDQRLVPLHLLRGPGIPLGATVHHPAVLHFLGSDDKVAI